MRFIKALVTKQREEWRKIAGAPEQYEVSNLGRIRSLRGRALADGTSHKGRIISQGKRPEGYMIVTLGRSFTNKYVHRLVAQAFIPNHNNLSMINHKDGNKGNNNVSNLEWSNKSLNALHFNRVIGNVSINPVIDLETGIYYSNALECFELNRDKIGHPYSTFKEALGGRRSNKTLFVRCAL